MTNKKSYFITIFFITLSACFIYMMNCGIRNNFGIMLSAITESSGISFVTASFVLAVGQMSFGITQPIFGIVADKKGNRFSLLTGIMCTFLGIVLTPFCKSFLSLLLILGILIPGGIGAISYGVIMGTINPRLPEKSKAVVSGIVNAASGIGNSILTPIISSSISKGGLSLGMFTIAVPTLLMVPVTLFICGLKNTEKNTSFKPKTENAGISDLFKRAFKNRSYIFIVLGFFTCGFHMALITNHLPTQITSYGMSSDTTGAIFSVYGVATMIGAFLVGIMCSKFKMKNVL